MQLNDLLLEARRNPELNPKIDIIQELSKYASQDGYYIHFTDLKKVGVNPQTEYFTPAGVYSYNLKREWNDMVNNTLPFAQNRKYIFLLKATKPVTNVKQYTLSNWGMDKLKLSRMFKNKTFSISMDTDTYSDFVEQAMKTKLSPDALGFYSLSIEELIEVAKMTTKNRMPFTMMWNATRLISMDGEKIDPNVWIWNKVMRSLGYAIFDDPNTGTIHQNEPSQCLFLTTNSFDVVDMLENKRRAVSDNTAPLAQVG